MSGTIDGYRFENVTADTYYAICDVRRNIKRFVEDSHTIDLNCNPVDGQREHKELNEVVTKNIIDAIKDRLYNIDTENKVIQGVDVEAVRCVVGRADFDNFFGQSKIFKDDLSPEVAVQLMDPLDGVIYCRKHGYEYPKEFSGVVLKSAAGTLQSLLGAVDTEEEYHKVEQGFVELADGINFVRVYCEDLAPELLDHFEECANYVRASAAVSLLWGDERAFIDEVCENFGHYKAAEQDGRKTIDVPEAENDGMEMGF